MVTGECRALRHSSYAILCVLLPGMYEKKDIGKNKLFYALCFTLAQCLSIYLMSIYLQLVKSPLGSLK